MIFVPETRPSTQSLLRIMPSASVVVQHWQVARQQCHKKGVILLWLEQWQGKTPLRSSATLQLRTPCAAELRCSSTPLTCEDTTAFLRCAAAALRCQAALRLPCEVTTALLRCAAAANALRCHRCAAAPCTAAAALPVDDRSTITTRTTTTSAADPRRCSVLPPLFLEQSKEGWRRYYFISRSWSKMESSKRFSWREDQTTMCRSHR